MGGTARAWMIRTGVVSLLAAAGFGAYLAATWVSPEQVRAAVVAHLESQFDDVDIQLGTAEMRLFGGLTVTDLTLTRRGESEPFAEVPHAVVYHDKEKLNRGQLEIRKVELTSPTLRVARAADGNWSIAGSRKTPSDDSPLPTLVVKGGTLIVTDLRADGIPPLAVRNLNLTLVNDPLPIIKMEGAGEVSAAGAVDEYGKVPDGVFKLPMRATVRVHRTAKHVSAHVETDEVQIGPDHAPLFDKVHPKAADYCAKFGGGVSLTADVSTATDPAQSLKYDVKVKLRNGQFDDINLPWPLSDLSGTVRLNDGKVSVEKMTGKLGTATAELALESKPDLLCSVPHVGRPQVPGWVAAGPRWKPMLFAHRLAPPLPAAPCPDTLNMAAVEEKLDKFELKVFSLSLNEGLFTRLTPDTQNIRKMFSPSGQVDVAVRFRRPDAGGWRREVDILPRGLSIEYEYFRYPITDVHGSLRKVNASDGTDEFQVKLTATAGDRLLSMTGKVAGGAHDPLVDLTIVGKDIRVDNQFLAALPGQYGEMLGKVGATARGDFTVTLKQDLDVNRWENTFKVKLDGGTIRHPRFPYTFKQVRGDVLVKNVYSDPLRPERPGQPITPRPDQDRVELKRFEAVHDGGRLWLSGESKAEPGTPDRKLSVDVQGENCPIDAEFLAGLKGFGMEGVAKQLAVRGELTFGADIKLWERAKAKDTGETPPFDPNRDLKIGFNFRGPSVTPDFFPYPLHNLAGVLRYDGGKVELQDFSADHGTSSLKLAAADVRFGGGAVWANLGKISIAPLVIDDAMLKALPPAARETLSAMNLRGPAELHVKHLVVSVGAKEPKRATQVVQVSAIEVFPPDDRWQAADRPRLLVRLPSLAEKPPPARSEVSEAVGLLPFTLPWHPTVEKTLVPPPPSPVVVYWNATLKLKGVGVELGVSCDDVHGALASEGRYENGKVGRVEGNAWLESATVAKQPLTDVKASYRVVPAGPDPKQPGRTLPAAVVFRDLTCAAFGGTVGGQARVELGEQAKFQIWLNASGVKLEQLAKYHKLGSGELKGDAQATVLVENVPDPKTGKLVLSGSGQIDVPQGRLYNLPVLLDLVKVLKGQTPDGVAFEEAHATFDLKGDRIKVTQLDLLGTAVSLGGTGEMDFSGRDVRFEFYTVFSQTLRRLFTGPVGDVGGAVSGGLFKIELTRVNGQLTPKAHVLPAITDPMRAIAERWKARNERTVRGAYR